MSQPVILWSHRLSSAPVGIAAAREVGQVVAADRAGEIVLYDRKGKLISNARRPAELLGAADDGSAFAIADKERKVAWLSADLAQKWSQTLVDKPTALAVDSLGRFV